MSDSTLLSYQEVCEDLASLSTNKIWTIFKTKMVYPNAMDFTKSNELSYLVGAQKSFSVYTVFNDKTTQNQELKEKHYQFIRGGEKCWHFFQS